MGEFDFEYSFARGGVGERSSSSLGQYGSLLFQIFAYVFRQRFGRGVVLVFFYLRSVFRVSRLNFQVVFLGNCLFVGVSGQFYCIVIGSKLVFLVRFWSQGFIFFFGFRIIAYFWFSYCFVSLSLCVQWRRQECCDLVMRGGKKGVFRNRVRYVVGNERIVVIIVIIVMIKI